MKVTSYPDKNSNPGRFGFGQTGYNNTQGGFRVQTNQSFRQNHETPIMFGWQFGFTHVIGPLNRVFYLNSNGEGGVGGVRREF